METVKLFYLENCPYCRNAKRALRELAEENAAYAAVDVEWIEESRQASFAERYDYYYVPTLFAGGGKLYEAHPGESYAACKAALKKALDAVLSARA